MNAQTTYEFPLNERIRVFMRLEQLFLHLEHVLKGNSIYDRRASINVLLDILTIFARGDLKSELIKELERHIKVLQLLSKNQKVDNQILAETLAKLNRASKSLYDTSGKIGSHVMESDLFQSIAQRNSIPGGTCSFDLPAFHYWLEQSEENQRKDLEHWSQPLDEIRNAIDLVLSLIRGSCIPRKEVALNGFFQLALDKDQPIQLLRIGIAPSLECYAEISGGKHRFSIRFMKPSVDENRPTQISHDIPFSLTCCIF